MSDQKTFPTKTETTKTAWADLFRDGRALYAFLVIMGTLLHSLQMLVMAIIMPTVVRDIGGAAYYTWTAMLYTIGSIVGSSALGPAWGLLGGARRGYTLSAIAFLLGTLSCALAPDMAVLIASRTVQGFAGGLVSAGNMAIIGELFARGMRTRILAIHQATFTTSHLFGPLVGGLFATLGWWRGSFWALVPFTILFAVLSWLKIPDHLGNEALKTGGSRLPVLRLTLLAAGVLCIATAGPVREPAMRVILIAGAVLFLWLTFRLDRRARNRLYPSNTLSMNAPVGLSLWILFLTGSVQATVTLFLPLLLQVVHGITPIFISFLTIVISFGWTVGTFLVSGWTGARARLALRAGPLLMVAGLMAITVMARVQMLAVLTLAAFAYGVGIGVHNVHLVARCIAAALKGEERVTTSAMPSIRQLGTAFGAALAGMLSTVAGLGKATEPQAVGAAVTFVYGFNVIPLIISAVLMIRLVRIGQERARPAVTPRP